MLLSEARERVRRAMIHDDIGIASDENVDRAIITVLEDFLLETRCAITSGTVALNPTSGTVNIQAVHSTFRPERAQRFEMRRYDQEVGLPGYALEHVDYDTVRRALTRGTAISTTTPPTMIAFRSPTEGFMDAAPGTVYPDLRVTWYDTLTAWTPGTVTPGTSVTLNVPDEYLGTPIWFGAASVVQHNDPASQFSSAAWQRYVDYRERVKGRFTYDRGVGIKDENAYL